MKTSMRLFFWAGMLIAGLSFCKGETEQKEAVSDLGIGPVKKVELGEINAATAAKGKELFSAKCSACHKMGEKYVGPDLIGVTKRRKAEWVMNMIMNPVEMTQKDPVAREMLATYYTQMTFQNLTEEETRNILEYFRAEDSK